MSEYPVPSGGIHPKVEQRAAAIEQGLRWNGLEKAGLCFRCRHGFITRRERDLDHRVFCHQINQRMPDDIADCSKFQSSGHLTIWELIQLADVIDVVTKKSVGFKNENEVQP